MRAETRSGTLFGIPWVEDPSLDPGEIRFGWPDEKLPLKVARREDGGLDVSFEGTDADMARLHRGFVKVGHG